MLLSEELVRGNPECPRCYGSGIFFIPGDNLFGHGVERCDACQVYETDMDAAEASGAEFNSGHTCGMERAVIKECPPGSLLERLNEELRPEATFVFIWDDGTEDRVSCRFNMITGTAIGVKDPDVDGPKLIERAYVELSDGTEMEISNPHG